MSQNQGLLSDKSMKIFKLQRFLSQINFLIIILLLSILQLQSKVYHMNPSNQSQTPILSAQTLVIKNQPNTQQIKHQQNSNHIKNFYRSNGLLNFVSQTQNRIAKSKGIKCFSGLKSGVSNDSPEHFQLGHTIIVGKGISNNTRQRAQSLQNKNVIKNGRSQSMNFYGNKNYFNISEQNSNPNYMNKEFLPQYENSLKLDLKAFNIKNSKCSKFIDENLNKWLGQNTPLMGIQRDERGRKLNNEERQNRIIQKMKRREQLLSSNNPRSNRQSINDWKMKTQRRSRRSNKSKNSQNSQNSNSSNKNSKLFILKSKLRSQRNQLANQLNKQIFRNGLDIKNKNEGLQEYQTHSNEYVDQKGFRSTASSIRPGTSIPKNNSNADQYKNMNYFNSMGHNKTKTISFDNNVALQNNQGMISKLDLWAAYTNPLNCNLRRRIINIQSEFQKLRCKRQQ